LGRKLPQQIQGEVSTTSSSEREDPHTYLYIIFTILPTSKTISFTNYHKSYQIELEISLAVLLSHKILLYHIVSTLPFTSGT
jgi:hypothetical protein